MKPLLRTAFLSVLALSGLGVRGARAQTPVRFSGTAFMDYYYVLGVPGSGTSESTGDHGFTYRRLYLTSDYTMSERISFRARLEANDRSVNTDGKPSPLVKDLFVRWRDVLGPGHELFIGISPTPIWEVSERFFGYRSVEATLLDRWGIASSRDFGVRLRGPVSDRVTYAVMIGNNSSVKPESDRHKRLYAQLEFRPGDRLQATLGGDYASMDGGHTVTVDAFAGYRLDRLRFGAEGFYSPVRFDDGSGDHERTGLSVFAAATASSTTEFLLRYDRFSSDASGTGASGAYAVAGAAFTVEKNLRIIPNFVVFRATGSDDALVTGRLTVEATF